MEEWRKIDGYNGCYLVSNTGFVKSFLGHTLTAHTKNHGYESVTLCKDGKLKTFTVHRLVALHFIPNPENKPQVNHKDGNRLNNNVENLEWVTNGENQQHRYNQPNAKKMVGEDNPNAVLTNEEAQAIKKSIDAGAKNSDLAFFFGVGKHVIRDIRSGKTYQSVINEGGEAA